MSVIRQAMLGAIVALGMGWGGLTDARAATINVTVTEPILTGAYTADVAGGEVFALGALDVFLPVGITTEVELLFSAYLDVLADFGEIDITTPSFDNFLTGGLIAFEFDAGVPKLRMLFEVLGGSAAPDFGKQFLVELVGLPGVEGDFLHQGAFTVSSVAVATVPLPATLPLLLLAISASVGIAARRRVLRAA